MLLGLNNHIIKLTLTQLMCRYHLLVDADIEEDGCDGEGEGAGLLARQVGVDPVRYRQQYCNPP
jgi:hypothetical protein